MKELQKKVYAVIRDDDVNRLSGTIFDSVLIAFIVINVLIVILDTFTMPQWYKTFSHVVEIVAVIFFTIEYILRVWTAPLIYPDKKPFRARLKYIFSVMSLIDLLSILPFYLPLFVSINMRSLQTLRILRLFRVFKISRYTDAFTIIANVFRKKAHQLFSSVLIVFVLMVIASMIMYDIESKAQPDKFNNAFSAFWWALSTVTTVGYGDLYPITTLGKIIGGFIAFLGIGLVAVPTGIISAGFIEESKRMEDKKAHAEDREKSGEKEYCPYCGKKLS